MGRRVVVVTEYVNPPIPIRNRDWSATLDGWEPGDPHGEGPSEADAVYDLWMEIEEREAEQAEREAEAQERHYQEMSDIAGRDPDEERERRRDDEAFFGKED